MLRHMSSHVHRPCRYETPKRVVYVDALPKTSTGKTQKHLLRSQLGLFFKR